MANYCSNSIVFYSKDKEVLSDLLDRINSTMDITKDYSVYDLLRTYDYNRAEIRGMTDCRDYFSYADKEVSQSSGGYYICKVQTESAWYPNLDTFYKLLKDKYADKIKMKYMSEEPSSDTFISNDVNNIFFKDRYKIDYHVNKVYGTEYFSTFGELFDYIIHTFPKADVFVYDSFEEMQKAIQVAYDTDNNKNFYFDIFSFKYQDDYEMRCA